MIDSLVDIVVLVIIVRVFEWLGYRKGYKKGLSDANTK